MLIAEPVYPVDSPARSSLSGGAASGGRVPSASRLAQGCAAASREPLQPLPYRLALLCRLSCAASMQAPNW